MLVKWNQPGPLSVGVGNGLVLIIPGVNHVERSVWELHENNPSIQEFIKTGKMEVIVDSDEKQESKNNEIECESDELSGLNVKKAVEIVKGTYRIDLLKKWSEMETRRGVITAIESQIETMTIKSAEK